MVSKIVEKSKNNLDYPSYILDWMVTTLHDEDLKQNASLIRNGTVHFIFANARLSNLWTVDMIIMGMGWNWFKCII